MRRTDERSPCLPGVFHSLEPLLDNYGYLAVAGLVFVEDFGVPVPGETILIAAAVYGRQENLASCTFDSVPLRVQERRKGDERGPLLVCPSCARRFIIGSRGPEEVPAEPGRPA